jgi:signal transduction histidine kinase
MFFQKNRQRDGENIYNAQDSNGDYFIQEAIAKARVLTGNNIDYQVYPWKNVGEDKARDKIAALIHDPQRNWVIGVGTYYDELADAEFEQRELENLKNELSEITVGKTGYIGIIDHEGAYVLSAGRSRDGENIIGAKDSTGREFIREWVGRGQTMSQGETFIDYYPWKNTGEKCCKNESSSRNSS